MFRPLTSAAGLSVLAGLVAGLISVSRPAAASEVDLSLARVSPAACAFQVGPGATCGELSVPENWSLGEPSRRISIMFVRVPARHPKPGRAPIAILTGGPGVSIFTALGLIAKSPLTEEQDAILIEPRGYGSSTPGLICNGVPDLAACYDRWKAQGYDLSQYGVEPAVRDFEALRRALKLGPWDLYGVSFGGFFALTEVRLYPGGIRSMVLDSPYPPEGSYDSTRAAALNSFGRVFDACKADPKCNKAYPDLRARFISGYQDLNAHPKAFKDRTFDGGAAFQPVYHALYMTPSFRFTPMLADALAREDLTALFKASEVAEAASTTRFEAPKDYDFRKANAIGLNAQMECADDIPFPGNVEDSEAFHSPWPKDVVDTIRPEGWDYDKRCAAWPTRPGDPVMNAVVPSDIPTLILSGGFDPIVPYRMSETTALHLSKATVMQDHTAAHVVIAASHPCVDRAIVRFLADPDKPVDTSCLAAIPAPRWALPAARTRGRP